MSHTRVSLALLTLAALACQKAAPPADESAAAADAIKAADIAWEKAFTSRDTTTAVSMVEATGSVLAPNAPIATGPEQVRNLFNGFYAIPGLEIHWSASSVGASRSGELGYSIGTYQMSFTNADGSKGEDHGKYSTVWRKQADGTWKVVSDQFNSDLPLPTP